MQPGGSQQDMKVVKQTDLAIAQSKSLARNKLAFAQQLKVSVPCNTNLRDWTNCKYPTSRTKFTN